MDQPAHETGIRGWVREAHTEAGGSAGWVQRGSRAGGAQLASPPARPGAAGPKNRVPAGSRFERFLLSRTGLTPVRDNKNLEKRHPVWATQKWCSRV